MEQERRTVTVTTEQLEKVAEMAATRAVLKARTVLYADVKNQFYKEVGKTIVSRFLIIVGAAATYITWYFTNTPRPH